MQNIFPVENKYWKLEMILLKKLEKPDWTKYHANHDVFINLYFTWS